MSCKETLFGIVPDEWTVSTIGEVTELKQGLQISKKLRSEESGYGYIPLLKITDLPSRVFSEYVKDVPKGYIASEEDIIYTRTGQVGLVYTGVRGCVHNNCFKVIPNENVLDRGYLYYYLKSNRVFKNSNNIASGSVQKDLTHKAFKTVKIGFPSLSKQKCIADILTSLDKKIELNNEMNKTLEEMAQALFKRWFVDFEFPNKDGKPYKSSGGEMVESELGMIPKAWMIAELGKLGKVITGKTPPTKDTENYGDEYSFITPVDMNNESFIIETQRNLSRVGYDKVKNFIIPDNSIGVTCIGSNLGEVYINAKQCFTNQQINSLILNDQKQYPYFYIILKNMKTDFLNIAGGSAVPIINKTTFSNIEIHVPNEEILEKFAEITRGFFEKIKENLIQSYSLRDFRDSLLPKLMSGEIRVEDIEANL